MLAKIVPALLLLPFLASAQSKAFRISGRSDYYNNRSLATFVGLYPVTNKYNDCTLDQAGNDSLYNPNALVRDGRFGISGTLRYPHPLFVSYFDAATGRVCNSYFGFVDGGDARITVGNLATDKSLGTALRNNANREYEQLKKYYCRQVDTVTGRVIDMRAKQERMKAYIAANPDSYVALWDLVFDYSFSRSDADKRRILSNVRMFSPSLQQSKTYRALLEDLEKDVSLTAGTAFPEMSLRPALQLRAVAAKNRFTLVDFWYSHCKPCLAQLPALQAVYSRYAGQGFSIVGISVDTKEQERDWQSAVQTFRLAWPQYLDANGVEAARLNIRSFPSSFLLNEKGVIVKKDLSPEELAAFLSQELGR